MREELLPAGPGDADGPGGAEGLHHSLVQDHVWGMVCGDCIPKQMPWEIPGVDGMSRASKGHFHLWIAVLDGAGPALSLCFPQLFLLLGLFWGFYYLRVKNAVAVAECAAIPKQTNGVQGKVKFPIIIFP